MKTRETMRISRFMMPGFPVLVATFLGNVSSTMAVSPPPQSAQHATICRGETAADEAKLKYHHWGVYNYLTATNVTPAKIICPMGATTHTGGVTAAITVWAESTETMSCTVWLTNSRGDPVYSGGTMTATNTAAERVLNWAYQNPTGQFPLFAYAKCSLPRGTSSTLHSWVSTLQLY